MAGAAAPFLPQTFEPRHVLGAAGYAAVSQHPTEAQRSDGFGAGQRASDGRCHLAGSPIRTTPRVRRGQERRQQERRRSTSVTTPARLGRQSSQQPKQRPLRIDRATLISLTQGPAARLAIGLRRPHAKVSLRVLPVGNRAKLETAYQPQPNVVAGVAEARVTFTAIDRPTEIVNLSGGRLQNCGARHDSSARSRCSASITIPSSNNLDADQPDLRGNEGQQFPRLPSTGTPVISRRSPSTRPATDHSQRRRVYKSPNPTSKAASWQASPAIRQPSSPTVAYGSQQQAARRRRTGQRRVAAIGAEQPRIKCHQFWRRTPKLRSRTGRHERARTRYYPRAPTRLCAPTCYQKAGSEW